MKAIIRCALCLAAAVAVSGCKKRALCEVTQYGPNHMTYTGPGEHFDRACRVVLHDLSHKEQIETGTRYPHYGEGATTHKSGDKLAAASIYLKTKDAEGADYKITTIKLGKRDPVVILECTSADPYKLVNALNAEFAKHGIKVKQY